MIPSLLGPLSALTAALVWGAADFSGGRATRHLSQYQVLALAGVSGGIALLLLALYRRESLPASEDLLWAIAAGFSGAMGLGALYRGLSAGNTALVAPVAAVVGALAPVVFELFLREPPSGWQWLGFGLGLAGIWLVSQTDPDLHHLRRSGLAFGFTAGACFGAYFILIGQIKPGPVFAPLFVSRCTTLAVALVMLLLRREELPFRFTQPQGSAEALHLTFPVILPRAAQLAYLAGFLDAGGNIFYLLAAQASRLDVAAVLSSFYPAVTVILAARLAHERLSRGQWAGLVTCLVAVILIIK